MNFYVDGIVIESTPYDHFFQDHPDLAWSKKIGALERLETLVNHYHGHIYSWKLMNLFENDRVDFFNSIRVGGDYVNGWSDCIGECDICAVDLKCLVDDFNCDVNMFTSNNVCKICPTWCLNGCNSDSSC